MCATEVLVGLGLGEVNGLDVNGRTVIESHNVPPFL